MTDMPYGWVNAPLASLADVQLGRQRSPKNHVGPNMKRYLRAANVTWNGLALNDVKEMHFSPSEFQTFRLAPGDILLSEASGSASEVGKPALWRGEIEDCCFQNTLLRVRTRHLQPTYLLWFFKWLAISGQFARGSRGVGIHHLGAKALSEWIVPVAPLEEQERVVAAIEEQMSRLDAGMFALNRIRQQLKQMRSAMFLELDVEASRNSPRRPIRDIAEFVLDGDHNPPRRTASGIPYLTARHVKQGKVSVDVTTFVSAEDFELMRRRYDPRPGDVLITCVGTLGEIAIVPEGLVFAADRNLAVIRPQDAIPPRYIEAILRSPRQQRVLTAGSGSTAQPHLYLKDLRAVLIPVPTHDVQERLLARLNARLSIIDQLEADLEPIITRSSVLRSSILSAAFSGRLTVQDPNDEPASSLLRRIADQYPRSQGVRKARAGRRRETQPPDQVTTRPDEVHTKDGGSEPRGMHLSKEYAHEMRIK